ncbi:hypothetical protein [Paenibacillus lignilyticus]|uniref:Uncharacterized protein n=1 Tax=Paenibacillus lignilyticus TaxID=1172615 RepID=A0ABS5C7H6_9BACL|nr:hypothetical protein [Paenibacillus lignilyticus]MBP3961946.1 hypothetical protein [Paenibacillus lignilyticus]
MHIEIMRGLGLSIQQGWHSLKGLDLRIGHHHGQAVTVGMNGEMIILAQTAP